MAPTGITAGALAERLSGILVEVDPARELCGVGSLSDAKASDVSFFANAAYRKQIAESEAGLILVAGSEVNSGAVPTGKPYLKLDDPYAGFCSVLEWILPAPPAVVHAPDSAFVHPEAILAEGVVIGAGVHVGAGARIGAGCILHPNVVVEPGVVLGEECVLASNTVVRYNCELGNRVRTQPGVMIGGDGFGYAMTGAGLRKIPQRGNVVIEDDVEIGAGSTVDRATFGSTRIGTGAKIDNLVMVAHNVEIGPFSIVVAQAGISGSTTIGTGVQIGGQAGLTGHIQIGDFSKIAAKSGVMDSLPANATVMGAPAIPAREFMRLHVLIRKLPEMWKKIRKGV